MKDLNAEPDFDPTLENELRQIAPAPVNSHLLERLEQAVTGSPTIVQAISRHPALNWRLWMVPATAVAGITLMALLAPQPSPSPMSSSPSPPQAALPDPQPTSPAANVPMEEPIELFPVRRKNEVMETVHEGILHVPGQAPYRKVRVQMMDSMEWVAPDGATRVEFQIPREEHLLVPMDIR